MCKRIISIVLALIFVIMLVPMKNVYAEYEDYEDVYIPPGYSYYGAWRWAVNDKFYIGYFTSSPYVNGTEMMYSYADGGNAENIKTCLNYKLYGGSCLYYKFDSYEDMVLGLSSSDACSRLSVSTNSSTGYMRLTAYPDVYFSNFSVSSGDCIFNENRYSAKLIDTYLGRNNNNSGYLVGAVVGSHDVSGFSEWFLNENKVNDLVNIGFSVSTDKVNDIIAWWDKYGGSTYAIGLGLPSLITITAINNLSITLVERVVYTLDSLYLQYLNYKKTQDIVLITPDNITHPHHRNPDIDYDLTVDKDGDTDIIVILREILRVLINLPSDISTYFNYIELYLDAILIDFNRILDSNINNIIDFDDINLNIDNINKICNDLTIKISDIIDIIDLLPDLPENVVDDYISKIDLLYEVKPEDNPILEFDNKISEKFPIIEQTQQIVSLEQFISEENRTPLITMKNPALLLDGDKSNDILLSDSTNTTTDITLIDFSEFDDILEVFKNILAFFIVLGYGHWLINFIPKLLAGYNESD